MGFSSNPVRFPTLGRFPHRPQGQIGRRRPGRPSSPRGSAFESARSHRERDAGQQLQEACNSNTVIPGLDPGIHGSAWRPASAMDPAGFAEGKDPGIKSGDDKGKGPAPGANSRSVDGSLPGSRAETLPWL